MSTLQEALASYFGSPSPTTHSFSSGIRPGTGEVNNLIWSRSDWPEPVGCARSCLITTHSEEALGLTWDNLRFSDFFLSHRAALFILQGMKLSDLLIPNHILTDRRGSESPAAHFVMMALWAPELSPPILRNLILSKVVRGEGLSRDQILGEIVKTTFPNSTI